MAWVKGVAGQAAVKQEQANETLKLGVEIWGNGEGPVKTILGQLQTWDQMVLSKWLKAESGKTSFRGKHLYSGGGGKNLAP